MPRLACSCLSRRVVCSSSDSCTSTRLSGAACCLLRANSGPVDRLHALLSQQTSLYVPAAFCSQKLNTVLLMMRAAQCSLFAVSSCCGCNRQVRIAGVTRDHAAALLPRLSAPIHLPYTHVATSISLVFVSPRFCAPPMAASARHQQQCNASLCQCFVGTR